MRVLPLLGRILFSLIFIASGFNHIANRTMMAGYAQSMGLPMAGVAVPLSGVIILLGGLSVLLGFYPRIGAWLLVIFLLPAAFYMHRFWGVPDQMTAANQMAHFMKNLAMTGGALFIAYFGTGPLSVRDPAPAVLVDRDRDRVLAASAR
jgi:putative oxidoreductase